MIEQRIRDCVALDETDKKTTSTLYFKKKEFSRKPFILKTVFTVLYVGTKQ